MMLNRASFRDMRLGKHASLELWVRGTRATGKHTSL